MTSRRSRLKAVTNLPVRRKPLQENASEGISNELSSSEKVSEDEQKTTEVISCNKECSLKNENVNATHNNAECNINKVPDFGLSELNVQNIIVISNENSNNKSETCEILNVHSNKSNDILPKNKTDSSYEFHVRSSKRFKPNLISSGHRTKSFEKSNENVELSGSVVTKLNSNSINNNNNNVVEDGYKSYTVLTPHNASLNLSEYTITPLTPCENTFIDSNLDDITPQDYEEVQVFTEIETTDVFTNNIDENSIIDVDTIEPALINVSSEPTVNSMNIENLYSNDKKHNLYHETSHKATVYSKEHPETVLNNVNDSGRILHSQSNEVNTFGNFHSISSDNHVFKQNVVPVKKKRSKGSEFTKKLADAKREFQKKYEKTKPDRSTLKMFDLIFYNPSTNPMESKSKYEKRHSLGSNSGVIDEMLDEEKIDEPEAQDNNSMSENSEAENSRMPVPQVKVGLDGEIIIDEKSLVIETTDARKGREGLKNSVPIFEDKGTRVSYYRGKNKKSRDWTDNETKRFYKALNTIGPDFTLMQKYFPKRSRLELKNKFKREERLNRSLIDKALNNPAEFDMTHLEKDLANEKKAEEEALEMRLCKVVKPTTKKPKVKSSFLSREVLATDAESENRLKTLESNDKRFLENEKNKRAKEFDFVFQKLLFQESEKLRNVLPEMSPSNHFKNFENAVT